MLDVRGAQRRYHAVASPYFRIRAAADDIDSGHDLANSRVRLRHRNTVIAAERAALTMHLDFSWATERWVDPFSGTTVVCLSPPDAKTHFRNNYFRCNLFSADGRFLVLAEAAGIDTDGFETKPFRLWALDMVSGDMRDLGEVGGHFLPRAGVWHIHLTANGANLVNTYDYSDPASAAILQIDIETGARRRVVPTPALPRIWDLGFSADDRYCYSPRQLDKGRLLKEMGFVQWAEMIEAQPGRQEMMRIDLRTGEARPIFACDTWCMGHPNPHPTNPDLFMCCQSYAAPSPTWGSPPERKRIRVLDLRTGEWLPTGVERHAWHECYHEHWARNGARIFAHTNCLCSDGHSRQVPDVHAINRIDLDHGTIRWFPSPRGMGATAHVKVAPNERFLVGDGFCRDKSYVPPQELRKQRRRASESDGHELDWRIHQAHAADTIWLYELPEESLCDDQGYEHDADRFLADLERYPERTVSTTRLAQYRSLFRDKDTPPGTQFESNADVTPDNRWVVFQSSSDDGWLQVWAARVPIE